MHSTNRVAYTGVCLSSVHANAMDQFEFQVCQALTMCSSTAKLIIHGINPDLRETMHDVHCYVCASIHAGADFIECDVVLTKDLVPVCRHEPWLAGTTDAKDKFPDRVSTAHASCLHHASLSTSCIS